MQALPSCDSNDAKLMIESTDDSDMRIDQAAGEGMSEPIGFIGIGTMGEPMAVNLVKSGAQVVAWNRTASRTRTVAAEGAVIARDIDEVFARCGTVVCMLANAEALDAVLSRNQSAFRDRVRGHTIVHMGTTAPAYSRELENDVRGAGGQYVEAPVSGSRKPAEAGRLVAMIAGEPQAVSSVSHVLAPMCRQVVQCGMVPNGLLMKLAVNIFLITMVTGLAEAVHFAERQRLDLEQFSSVLTGGPMASEVARTKFVKLASREFSVQAAIANVRENNRLILETARATHVSSPVMDTCYALYEEAAALGLDDADMAAVVRAFEARSYK